MADPTTEEVLEVQITVEDVVTLIRTMELIEEAIEEHLEALAEVEVLPVERHRKLYVTIAIREAITNMIV